MLEGESYKFTKNIYPLFVRLQPALMQYLVRLQPRMIEQRLAQDITDARGATVARGVNMLNRQAGLYYLNLWLKTNAETPYVIQTFDLKNFKSLDYIKNGYNFADLTLNLLSRRLQEATNLYERETGLCTYSFRYGGDEFAVICLGSGSGRREQALAELLTEQARALKLTFKDGVESIPIPTDPIYEGVFEYFLRRNLLLSPAELEQIVTTEDLQSLKSSKNKLEPHQPDYLKTLRELRFRREFWLKPALEEFYRQIIIRPGVEHEILNVNTFERQAISYSIRQLWVIDIKFLKEVNDGISYVEGDRLINQVLRQLTNLFPPGKIGRNIFIGCRGGLVLIGLHKKGQQEMDPAIIAKIESYIEEPTHPVEIRGKKINIPLGTHHAKNADTRLTYRQNLSRMHQYAGPMTARVVRHLLDSGITAAEQNWYSKIITQYPESTIIRALQRYRLRLVGGTPELQNTLDYLCAFLCGTKQENLGRLPGRYATRFDLMQEAAKNTGYSYLTEYLKNIRNVILEVKPTSPSSSPSLE